MKKVLVLPNPGKPAALELGSRLICLLEAEGFAVVLEETIARQFKMPQSGVAETQLFDGVELVLVLGGDGSMLNAARRIYPRQIPLLGINLGHLGFLTTVESNRLAEACRELREGNYQLEDRVMLQGEVIYSPERAMEALSGDFEHTSVFFKENMDPLTARHHLIGLNELVMAKSLLTRMIRLETWIDNEFFTTYPADGLIVATATGSTAYSLSAGGPIMDPRVAALVMTPICPHSLYARPVVLCPEAHIKVRIEAAHHEISLTADGQAEVRLCPGDEVHFYLAPYVTKILRLKHHGIFETLRSRFKEGRI